MEKKPRTLSQNSSLHLWFTHISQALNNEGHTFQDLIKKIERAEIMVTPENVKFLYQEMCMALYGTNKTSELESDQVGKVNDTFNLWLAHNFELHAPFPSDDGLEHITEKDL